MLEGTVSFQVGWEPLVEEFMQNTRLLEPSKVQSSIEDLRRSLLAKGVDLTTKCSSLTAKQMTAINEILYLSWIQIRESEGGALELTTTRYTHDDETPNEEIIKASFLFCWLLSGDADIKAVDVTCTPLLSRLPSVLKLALASNVSVRSVRVCLWANDTKVHGSFLAEGLHRSATSLEVYDNDGLEFTDDAAVLTAAVFRRSSRTLREVSLRSGPLQTTSKAAVQLLLEALVGSSALTTLSITGYMLSEQGGLAVAKVLESSSKLVSLRLDCVGEEAMVVVNKAMATNMLPQHSDQEMNSEAAACSVDGELGPEQIETRAAECVTWSQDPSGLQKLARALRNGSNIKKVSLDCAYASSSFYLGQVFSALGSNPYVTDLHIALASYFDIYAARLLSSAFKQTQMLKEVHFCYEFEDPDIFMTLLVGLACNRSIENVDFGCMFLYRPIPEVLGSLMRVNNTLRSLRIKDCSLQGQNMKPVLEGLSANYTLTDVHLGELEHPGDELFQVEEFVRRNRRLLNRALWFVLGRTTDDESQEAFQKLSSSASLLEEVAKVEKCSTTRARELVRAAEERLDGSRGTTVQFPTIEQD